MKKIYIYFATIARLRRSFLFLAVAILLLQKPTHGEETLEPDFFYHELFNYGRIEGAERDPTLPITEAEAEIVRGEAMNYREGVAAIKHAWQRVGIVRAIGYQKRVEWIPTLIEKTSEIYWPRSSVQRAEVVHPCVWALANIGEPSVEPILEAVAKSADLQQRKLLRLALEGIRGKKGAAALLQERGININLPINNQERPTRRDVSPTSDPEHESSGKAPSNSDPRMHQEIKGPSRMIWLAMAFFLLPGFVIVCLRRCKRTS